jgi:hypothetical protein
MALDVTPVQRNLRTRVTFLGSRSRGPLRRFSPWRLSRTCWDAFLHREMFGLPMNMVIQYLVPVLSIPGLMLFKYGKQRGYLLDWVQFHTKPHVYSGLDRDTQLQSPYLKYGDE